jgi:hypothetical protein
MLFQLREELLGARIPGTIAYVAVDSPADEHLGLTRTKGNVAASPDLVENFMCHGNSTVWVTFKTKNSMHTEDTIMAALLDGERSWRPTDLSVNVPIVVLGSDTAIYNAAARLLPNYQPEHFDEYSVCSVPVTLWVLRPTSCFSRLTQRGFVQQSSERPDSARLLSALSKLAHSDDLSSGNSTVVCGLDCFDCSNRGRSDRLELEVAQAEDAFERIPPTPRLMRPIAPFAVNFDEYK